MRDAPRASIVVRTYNEGRRLRPVLEMLSQQTLQAFELIIVDNCSIDGTLSLLDDFPVSTLVSIPRDSFGHAFSTNLGVFVAHANWVVLMNGHSLATSRSWLEAALENFQDPMVAAVDGYYTAYPDGSIWERISDLREIHTLRVRRENLPITTTNAIIRRDLWLEYQFDEGLPECEDYDWALEMIARGYKTVKEPRFNVLHSHGLSLAEMRRRKRKWKSICSIIDLRKRPRTSRSVVRLKSFEELGVTVNKFSHRLWHTGSA